MESLDNFASELLLHFFSWGIIIRKKYLGLKLLGPPKVVPPPRPENVSQNECLTTWRSYGEKNPRTFERKLMGRGVQNARFFIALCKDGAV